MLGLRSSRHVPLKEVIISEFDMERAERMLDVVASRCLGIAMALTPVKNLFKSYFNYFVVGIDTHQIHTVSDEINRTVDYLSDCRDPRVVMKLSNIPIIRVLWVYAPTPWKWLGYTMLPLLPISVPLWLYGRRCLRNLRSDLEKTAKICEELF